MAASTSPAWREKAESHRLYQQSLIPPEWRLDPSSISTDPKAVISTVETCGILSQQDLEITSLSNTSSFILDKIRSRTWSAVEVTTAFCKRAALLQQLTGCLTEIMFEAGIARAKELDDHLSSTGEVLGPLHGLPLSLKDNHDIVGVDSTVGWVGLIGKPAVKDAPAVEEYRKLGAVFYVKTNVPQSLMMSDSYNHVWGQSVNSLDARLISGGSSGGEGALVAAGGSVIGLGTDIGGSVRIPASLQGLYGLSPTVGRVGNRESIRSQKYMCLPVAGPIGRDLSDLEVFMKAYLGSRPWDKDPCIYPVPWDERKVDEFSKKGRLKIGYVLDDGVVLPQPPVRRAVMEIVMKLKNAGHEVIEWDAKDHREGYDLWLKAVLADGGERCKGLCQIADEPLIEGMLVGKPENLLDNAQRQVLADEIFDYQRRLLKRWAEKEMDAVIMPVTQWAGMRPKEWVKSDMWVGYTAISNLLNWTSLAIPATKVSKDVDSPDEKWKNYEPRSFSDKFNHDAYDVDLFEGMPVGVQLLTGRFGEEKAFGIAKLIDTLSG